MEKVCDIVHVVDRDQSEGKGNSLLGRRKIVLGLLSSYRREAIPSEVGQHGVGGRNRTSAIRYAD